MKECYCCFKKFPQEEFGMKFDTSVHTECMRVCDLCQTILDLANYKKMQDNGEDCEEAIAYTELRINNINKIHAERLESSKN